MCIRDRRTWARSLLAAGRRRPPGWHEWKRRHSMSCYRVPPKRQLTQCGSVRRRRPITRLVRRRGGVRPGHPHRSRPPRLQKYRRHIGTIPPFVRSLPSHLFGAYRPISGLCPGGANVGTGNPSRCRTGVGVRISDGVRISELELAVENEHSDGNSSAWSLALAVQWAGLVFALIHQESPKPKRGPR